MAILSFLTCFVISLVAAHAADLNCPSNSRGQYPACKCLNNAVYDPTYNWCVSNLEDLSGKCPEDGPGIFPNCDCISGKSFNSIENVCYTVDRSVCPSGATGNPPNCRCAQTFAFDEVHWYCRPWYLSTTTRAPTTRIYKPVPVVPRCTSYQRGAYPDCHPIPCSSNSLNPEDFEPHCRYNYTHVEYIPCPHGLIGSPPNCYKPCPAYHTGRYPDCQRIKCQTGAGWSGEYAPDCKFTPTCPPEFPGVWPYCDIYKAKIVTESNTYLPPTYLPPTKATTKKPVPTYLPPISPTS